MINPINMATAVSAYKRNQDNLNKQQDSIVVTGFDSDSKRIQVLDQLTKGDLILITLHSGAKSRGLFVRKTGAQFIGIQTYNAYEPIPIEWVKEIKVLMTFDNQN